ncbi:MAG: prolyl oligopeptidase family serine peptidase [Ignavibacterium sp.]|nr:MAG: prolyl oligopeptidase family serine peptidase [Ignavibacterium sp.]
MSDNFFLNTQKNNVLNVTAYGLELINKAPCLILVHGFKGFKDWGFFPYTGEYFSKNGFFVLTFNFSHNGIGDNLNEFTELDKFAQNTLSLELSELNEVITAYKKGFFGEIADKGIGLVGHSRGGAVALLVSSKRDDIHAVATWSAVSNFNRYPERQKNEWRKNGFFEIINSRTKQVMKLNVSLLEDIESNRDNSLSIEKAVKKLNTPLLIAHGEIDLTVPIKEGEAIYHWSDKEQTELFIVKSAGHTFDIVHPFEGSNQKLDSVLNKTKEFFNTYLN